MYQEVEHQNQPRMSTELHNMGARPEILKKEEGETIKEKCCCPRVLNIKFRGNTVVLQFQTEEERKPQIEN